MKTRRIRIVYKYYYISTTKSNIMNEKATQTRNKPKLIPRNKPGLLLWLLEKAFSLYLFAAFHVDGTEE